ncbi:MAG: TolC family protein [Mongoliitalea sp.]
MKTVIKGFAVTLSLLFQLVSPPQLSAQNTVVFTLEEAISYALQNNPDAKNAALELLASKAIIRQNLASGLPQINGNYDFTYNAAIPVIFLPNVEGAPFFNPDNPADVVELRFGVDFQSNLGVRIDQMIFDGSYFVGLKAAKTLNILTAFDKEKAEIDVRETVKKAYFTVLVNDERRRIFEVNLERVETLLRETEALYEAGFVEKIDVSRTKVQRNNLKTELDKIVAATAISVEVLKLQMGLPSEYTIELAETIRDFNNIAEVTDLLATEMNRRVELDQLKTNMDLTRLDMKNNQIQYMPNLNAFLTYTRSGASLSLPELNRNDWFTGAFVGFNLSIPIFDGFSKAARIQQNRVQLRQLENQQDFLKRSFEVEVYQAKVSLSNSVASLRLQAENMDLALEVFEMAKIKFQEGVGSNLEVVDADSALKEAETNYFAALYDALIAKVDLEKALGLL